MIQIDDILLSEDLFTAHFVCDLAACKGACCVEGDSGAPVEMDEIDEMEANLSSILPFLTEEGKKTIEKLGVFVVDVDGEYGTPLNSGKECAFTTYDKNGTAKCGIEDAYRAGKSSFKKPISCHLYPIRVKRLHDTEALNYHTWDICKPACECGSKLQVKVYQFLKEPLIKKYGEEWYEKLQIADQMLSHRQ